MAIVLDGVVQNIPKINRPITSGRAVLRGNYTDDQIDGLVAMLQVGSLPASFHLESQDRIGPTLGREAIVAGVSANLRGAWTCHHGHMPEIELQGEHRATGIWAMSDIVDHPRYLLHGWGHYHEEYVKQSGGWRIQRLELTRLREDRTPKAG